MDDVQEAVQLEENLNALPDNPTEEEIVQATKGFRGYSVSIAMYKLLEAAGGGGGATPTLVEVLEAGNDGDFTGILNTGNIATGGGDLDIEGGNIQSGTVFISGSTGNIDSGGGDLVSSGGDIDSGSGDLVSSGGDLNLGAGLVKSDLVLTAGKLLDLTASGGVNLIQGTSTFLNADQEVPAVATVQDVIDALLNLGLITQAAP